MGLGKKLDEKKPHECEKIFDMKDPSIESVKGNVGRVL